MSTSTRNFLIVAGEISGDHHAAPLMNALSQRDSGLSFWGLGGDQMALAGLDVLFHVKNLSVTGFIEVIKHLSFFRKVMFTLIEECQKRRPVAAILLDYPGFNLRLGMKLKRLGIPVYYYISPQVWAWKKGRVKTMRRFIKHIFVIFPFEKLFYEQHNIPVTFAGHPLVEKDFHLPERLDFFNQYGLEEKKPLVALLPGSRRNELERHTRPLLEAVQRLQRKNPDIQFVLACLSDLSESYYEPFKKSGVILCSLDNPYPLMAHADLAIVASGTASLETAYLGTPLIVIYRVAFISYLIGKLLVDIDHLAMPNLIIGERAIPELIQKDMTGSEIARQAIYLLSDKSARQIMLNKLSQLKSALGQPGCAKMIAQQILTDLG